MTKRRAVSKGQYAEVRLGAEARLGMGWTPAETLRWLEDQVKAKEPGFTEDRIPTLRTIQNWAARVPPPDESGSWHLSDSDIDDPSLVLETLGAVIRVTEGRVTSLTRREARLIETVARACPDVVPADRWRLARDYIAREDDNETSDLDAFLALAPWRSYEAEDAYMELVRRGRISAPIGVTIQLTDAHPREPRPEHFDDEMVRLDGELRELQALIEAKKAGQTESRKGSETVSSPVSDDRRSATGRRRSKRPQVSTAQDMTDGDE